MKLLGNTENKITKDENGESVLHLRITNVILVHFSNANNDYQQDSRVLYTFVPVIGSIIRYFTQKFSKTID